MSAPSPARSGPVAYRYDWRLRMFATGGEDGWRTSLGFKEPKEDHRNEYRNVVPLGPLADAPGVASHAPGAARFVKWALREGPWQGGDLDGGGIQDKAEELGLIVKTQYDPKAHGESEFGARPGDDWYVLAPEIVALAEDVPGPWRTIETAPKNGKIVDLWWVHNDGEHEPHRRPDCSWAEHLGGWVWDGVEGGRSPKDWTATHWMPRPAPPLA